MRSFKSFSCTIVICAENLGGESSYLVEWLIKLIKVIKVIKVIKDLYTQST